MKKSIIYMAALLAAAGFTSCQDDFERPPYYETGDIKIQANTTIEELKNAFTQDVNFFNTPIGTKENGEHYIIRGRVTSDTRAGNVFKKVCVEDATGGIIFSVNDSRLYEVTPLGQEVIVDCTGMYYGNYGFGVQVGSEGEGHSTTVAPARMPEDMWDAHVTAIGVPDPALVTVHEVTLDDLRTIYSDPATRLQWQGLLVKVKDVKFQNPGTQLGKQNQSNNSVYLVPAAGGQGRLAINTSGYSTLWDIYAPNGTGDVTGVLAVYNTDWQLSLNDANGIGDTFTPWVPAPPALYEESFATNQGGFSIHNIEMTGPMTYVWKHDASRGYMVASGFVSGASYASSSWLLSPVLDLTATEEPSFTFDHVTNKFPDLETAKRQVSMAISVDGGAWQTVAIKEWSTNADWNFVNAGTYDLSAYAGKKIVIGFHYTSEDGASGSWEIKNFAVNGKGTVTATPGADFPGSAK